MPVMSYFWPIKDRSESRIIYICQLLRILLGIFLFAGFNHWKIGLSQWLWGIVAGWFIGAFIYVKLAARETGTESSQAPGAEGDIEVRSDNDENGREKDFVIAADGDTDRYVSLDDPCLNHFTYFNRYEIYSGESEFEYRIDGTRVFVRLLQDFSDEPGKGREWDVRDGVVMESDMRARDTNEIADFPSGLTKALRSARGSVDENIADLNKQTEWCELLLMGIRADFKDSSCAIGSHLVGLKYFMLSQYVPPADARRLIRQELERLKMGIGGFTKEAAKLGLEPGGRHGLKPMQGRPSPSGDEISKLVESIPTFGISYREFTSREWIVAALEKQLTAVKTRKTPVSGT